MKIAQVVCVYPPYRGGIGTSALETARVLSSAGQQIETFTLAKGDSGKADEKAVRLKTWLKVGNGGFLPQLIWLLPNFDLVYLHCPFFGAAETIWFLKRFVWGKKIKLIIHFHMEPKLSSPLLKLLSIPSRLIEADLFRQADLIICASRDYAKANLPAAIWTANQGRIQEIPFSVDTERFKPTAGKEEASPYFGVEERREDIFKILFVGGLDKAHYFKGVNVLLDSLILLDDKEQQNWQLEIVGDGDLRGQYEKQAIESGLEDKIIFAGSVSDEELPQKYRAADCLVLPSINQGEAFGIVLLEAMASGIPVIASDLPGVCAVFTDGREGLLVEPGNVLRLADKLRILMDSREKRQEMGRAARKLAETKYAKAIIADKLAKQLSLI